MSDAMEYLPEWAGPIVDRMAEADRLGLLIRASLEMKRVDFTRNSPNIGYTLTPEEQAETAAVGIPIIEHAIQDIRKLLKEVEDQARIIHDLREDRDTVYVVENKTYYDGRIVVGVCCSLSEAIRLAEAEDRDRFGYGCYIFITSWGASGGRLLGAFNGRWTCPECDAPTIPSSCPCCHGTGKPQWEV